MKKNSSSRSNLINLALIYNYLVNKEDKISVDIINKYFEVINKYLKMQHKDIISPKDNQKDNFNSRYHIIVMDQFIKLNIDNINLEELYLDTIHSLDDYLINISLNERVLDVLKIKRDDLPIENYYESKNDIIDIYMTTKKDMAETVARKHLEMKGMKDVQINGSELVMLDDDLGYRVYTSYNLLCDYLNIDKFNEYLGGFQKRMIYNDEKR